MIAAAAVRIRALRDEDADRCVDIFYAAIDDLYDHAHQQRLPRNPESLTRAIRHFVATDPDGCWAAAAGPGDERDALVAFGASYQRDWFWFLALLFVVPDHQATGVGRRILQACLPHDASSPEVTLATCVESIQPVSTALYARAGLVPRVPLYSLQGRPKPGRLPPLPRGVEALTIPVGSADGRALDRAVAELDHDVLGYHRPSEHAAWRADGRRLTLFRDGASRAALGYGYVREVGRIGPVAVRDPEDAPALLGHLLATLEPPGAWEVVVPGPFAAALIALLEAGLRIDGSPALFSATQPVASLERYLPNSFALL